MNYKLFLAWQSQNENTEKYIRKELKRIQKDLSKDGFEISIVFSPTQEESGSPDIKASIVEQIKNSDVFIGDLSFIDTEKHISNGNVLYESGIADAFLGEERVILICDENTIIENIAFDINHKRISKINTSQEKSQMKMWIRTALEEADRHRYIKTYATNQYEEDILVLLNYFYKFINMNNKYTVEFVIPTVDEIEKKLSESKYPAFILNTDFNPLIEQLEEKMLRLNQFSHKRIIWNVINIITKLKEYQKFCTQIRYAHIIMIDNEQEQYNIYDAKNFFLKSMDDFSFDNKTVLFLDNSELIQGKNDYYVMDKRIYREDSKKYREELLPLAGGAQRVIAGRYAFINKDAISAIAPLISNILYAVKEYLDYCEMSICIETEALLTIR